MSMSKKEQEIIANIIKRLGDDGTATPEIREMLNNRMMRLWLDTWVTGALECMLEPHRNIDLGVRLSRR
jgi:hypothetical protein